MQKKTIEKESIEKYINEHDGIIKTAELENLGVDYRRQRLLISENFLVKIKNGYYGLAKEKMSDDDLVIKLFGDGILTMESALYEYGYINEKPETYSIAIDKNVSKSRFKIDYPKVIPFYVEKSALDFGITDITFANGKMKIYTRERLICEVLKYEKKTEPGLSESVLRAYFNDPAGDLLKLMEAAERRQVKNKLREKMEALKKNTDRVSENDLTKNSKIISEGQKIDNRTKNNVLNYNKEQIIYESLSEILGKLFLLDNMEAVRLAVEGLENADISGREACKCIREVFEKNKISINRERMEIFISCRNDLTLKKRWKTYLGENRADGPEWEETFNIIYNFINPLWSALCKNGFYLGDWIGSLGRYLD